MAVIVRSAVERIIELKFGSTSIVVADKSHWLAAFGLYGLTAFSVAQRTREIAIRMALGASRQGVLWMVLGQAGRLALLGAAIGIAMAVGFSLLLSSLLIGLQPVDAMAFGAAFAVLGCVMVAASWVPARRAATMDPMRALRAE